MKRKRGSEVEVRGEKMRKVKRNGDGGGERRRGRG